MKIKRIFLVIALIALMALAVELGYIFYKLSLPTEIKEVKSEKIVPVLTLYGFGKNPSDFFDKPHDIAVDKNKNIYVSDTRNGRIVVLSLSGRLISIIDDKEGGMSRPLGIDISDEGKIYVCDRFASSLFIFNKEGTLLKRIRLKDPIKPVVASDKLYVATRGTIAVFDLNGNYIFHWGKPGRKPGEFSFPNDIASDEKGNLYVSDLNNLRVQAFSPRGDLLWVLGQPPKDIVEKERTFGLPAGCAIGADGNLYIVDAFQDEIVAVDTESGEIITSIGGERGSGEGEFRLPSGIDWVEENLFVVADKYNDRIQLLKLNPISEEIPEEKEISVPLSQVLELIFSILALILAIYSIRKLLSWYRQR